MKIWEKTLTALSVLFWGNSRCYKWKTRQKWSHLRRIKQCIYKTFCLWKPGGRKGSADPQALSHLDPSTKWVQVCWLLWAERVLWLLLDFSKIGNVWQHFLVKQHPRFPLWGCCQCSHAPWGCSSDWARFLPNSNLPSPHITMDHRKRAYSIFLVQTLQQYGRWWWKNRRHKGFS